MALNIFYYSLLYRKTKSITIENNENIEDLYEKIASNEEIYDNSLKLYLNGKHLDTIENLRNDSMIRIHECLNGGKGGFGSMLRAIGAQIEKTTNREACRDLSGRRLRDVNEEKRIKEWIAKQAKRKEESERKRREKLERLASKPKCDFNDTEFERNRSEIPDIVEEALQYGLQQQLQQSTSSGVTANKRKTDDQMRGRLKKQKHSLWLGIDDIDEDSDENEEIVNDSDIHKDKEEEELLPNDSINNSITDGVKSSTIDMKVNETLNEALLEHKIETIVEPNDKNENNSTVNVNEIKEVIEHKPNSIDSNVDPNEKIPESSQHNREETLVEPLNLLDYESIDRLESVGLDRLKQTLMSLGLKCGGTLQERAKRLWSVRGLDTKDIPKNLFAFKKKNK